jgi:O-antigen/teichoic acid export membrane protein
LSKIASGTVMAFGGAILGIGLTYLYGLMIGRSLGAESVGLYFLALVIMQLANAICRLGLPEGLLRFVAIRHGEGDVSRVKGDILSALMIVGTEWTGRHRFLHESPAQRLEDRL